MNNFSTSLWTTSVLAVLALVTRWERQKQRDALYAFLAVQVRNAQEAR